MYSDYSCQQRDKFIHEKMFFPNMYNSRFPFFLRSFSIIMNVGLEIFIKKHMCFYTPIIKPEAATEGVL